MFVQRRLLQLHLVHWLGNFWHCHWCYCCSTGLYSPDLSKCYFLQTHTKIGLTPLIALIYTSVEPAVTQNCVASVTNKNLLKSANNLL